MGATPDRAQPGKHQIPKSRNQRSATAEIEIADTASESMYEEMGTDES